MDGLWQFLRLRGVNRALSQQLPGFNPASDAAHDTSSRPPCFAFSPWANKEFLYCKCKVLLFIMHQGAANEEDR